MKHYMIAHLLAQGKPQTVVARKLNISTQTIQNCLQTPSFLILLDNLRSEYAERIADCTILPFAEMQQRINEEALGALSRLVDISCGERASATMLNANLALLDRSSNTPKASKIDPSEARNELFNVSVLQVVLETALQVGDKTVIQAAERALNSTPRHTIEQESFIEAPPKVEIFDSSLIETLTPARPATPFAMKSLDDLINDNFDELNDTDSEEAD
jgi:hypothetical protein